MKVCEGCGAPLNNGACDYCGQGYMTLGQSESANLSLEDVVSNEIPTTIRLVLLVAIGAVAIASAPKVLSHLGAWMDNGKIEIFLLKTRREHQAISAWRVRKAKRKARDSRERDYMVSATTEVWAGYGGGSMNIVCKSNGCWIIK